MRSALGKEMKNEELFPPARPQDGPVERSRENGALDQLGQLPPWTRAKWGEASLVNNVVCWEFTGRALTSLRPRGAPGPLPAALTPTPGTRLGHLFTTSLGTLHLGSRDPMTPKPENVPTGRPAAWPPESRGRGASHLRGLGPGRGPALPKQWWLSLPSP